MFIKFINREREFHFLEDKLKKPEANLIILYGRRRVGKTELIKEFFKGGGAYFLSPQDVEKEQMREFSKVLSTYFKDKTLKINPFTTFYQVMEYIAEKAKKTRIILAIDEFPYLVEANPAVPSIIQKHWDERLKDTNIFLILCGSSIGMMEDLLGYRSPLYGRRTGQWKLTPLGFTDTRKFLPKFSIEDQIRIFAVTGGVPYYLSKLRADRSVTENITDEILTKGQALYEEVEFLLKEELREPRIYFSILKAVASGNTTITGISNFTGIKASSLVRYMDTLMDLDLLERTVPVTEKHPTKSKKGIYKITDDFFKFWFRFAYPMKSDLEIGNTKPVIFNLQKNFNAFVGEAFEKISREFIWKLGMEDELPFPLSRIGKWWHLGEEIDLVALNEEDREIAFFEVKWSKLGKKDADRILTDLKRKAELVKWHNSKRKEHFGIIAKRIKGKDGLKKQGHLAYDLRDFERFVLNVHS